MTGRKTDNTPKTYWLVIYSARRYPKTTRISFLPPVKVEEIEYPGEANVMPRAGWRIGGGLESPPMLKVTRSLEARFAKTESPLVINHLQTHVDALGLPHSDAIETWTYASDPHFVTMHIAKIFGHPQMGTVPDVSEAVPNPTMIELAGRDTSHSIVSVAPATVDSIDEKLPDRPNHASEKISGIEPLQRKTMKGWVYVMTNPSMPGLIKVGFSMSDPELRARELGHTGIPGAYLVEYEVLTGNPFQVEQAAHA